MTLWWVSTAISTGARVNGMRIGEESFVGSGSVISMGCHRCRAVIGSGLTVLKDGPRGGDGEAGCVKTYHCGSRGEP